MICPNCLKTVEDGTTFCPHCHAYVGGPAGENRSDFVFCEGCGARLSIHDRTCPKCGRPAPGILSVESASSDLAAGRTASFPRLTPGLVETEASRPSTVSVAEVINDTMSPAETSVLRAADLEQQARKFSPAPVQEDPYHTHRRSYKGLVIALVLMVLVGGAAGFIYFDPMHVMPGFYESFQNAAHEMFPSRQLPEDGAASITDDSAAIDAAEDDQSLKPLTDDQVFEKLTTIYQQVVDFGSAERFGTCVDDFNSAYLAKSHADREQASSPAYELRDSVKRTIDELDQLQAPADTVYAEDIEHMKQLAQWMYGRIDQICSSWDVSLSYEDGELPVDHQDEILAPMRRAGSSDYDSYYANIEAWEPQRK